MSSFFQTHEGRKRMVGGGALAGGGIMMEVLNDHHGVLGLGTTLLTIALLVAGGGLASSGFLTNKRG